MSNITIKLARPHVEELLGRFESLIGKDFPGYRNHIYRTITYAMHFLENAEEYERIVEAAFVYHDIGLWTDRELAYLEPSEAMAIADNEKFGWGLDPEILRGAIHWHHKIFPYSGPHQRIIEACRKADWIDASKGMLRKGISKAAIKEVEAAFPNLGFHDTLLRLAKDYGGSTLVGGIKVTLGIVKW
ncbi:phosphohydrolase [Vibrio cholerae]|uniref:Phosphohydrolase n=2 Tax=Vibrio cholerae TaxID=666 RepID=A0A395TXZ7_VIBCL|nr:phosphohydrolase [Vibrio cholerae]RGP89451.1 phosphohydrolase [Vibrio cholerae]RGP89647.1 phosphohydrolase [Vibrio cholerae]RGP89657.1 phosphohydrolase [Vibrio cholerae]RGP95220.1 phosphohydrolase [Vibrio cholerae]